MLVLIKYQSLKSFANITRVSCHRLVYKKIVYHLMIRVKRDKSLIH